MPFGGAWVEIPTCFEALPLNGERSALPAPESNNPPRSATPRTVTERRLVVIISCMRKRLAPKIIDHLKTSGPKRMDVWDTVLRCFCEGLAWRPQNLL